MSDAGVARAAFAYIGAFVDELARSGVRHACVAPGSRSTPLALALAEHAAVRTWMHLDERSAAFFALGIARWLGEPVALLCTSGTAAANFLPAVAEARHGRVPLVVLTADRPPELRDAGAAQTIDQVRLFGTHAKWFVDVALPEATPPLLRYARTLACRATALAAAAPAGPVHLNFPFREPLVPVPVGPPAGLGPADLAAWRGRADGAPWVRVTESAGAPDATQLHAMAARLRAAQRPVLVCGPQPDAALAAPLAALAAAVRAPLLADPLSQVRWGPHRVGDGDAVVDAYDALLRDDATAARLAPDLVVRVGAVPTSTPVQRWLERHGAELVVVDAAGWPEPTGRAAVVVHAEPRAWAVGVVAAVGAFAASDGDQAREAPAVVPNAGRSHSDDADRTRGLPPEDNLLPPTGSSSIETPQGVANGRATSGEARGAPPNGTIARGRENTSIVSAPAGTSDRAPSAWLAAWQTADRAARAALDAHADALADEPFEGRVLRDVAAALPDGATLWVSSSMPVRDLDTFAAGDARRLRVLANRGANGIDGVVSSALGAAAAAAEQGEGPVALVVGDLAFYHDMNGLLAARLYALDTTIVLVNNDGGGIFSFLPQADGAPHFERLFGTPHGLDFRPAVTMYGGRHLLVDDPASLGGAVVAAFARPGLDVLEVRTERARNVVLHGEAWRAVADAVASAMRGHQ